MRIGTGRRVLVTGGCGFIGSHLVRRLLAAGCHVLNLDKLTYAGNPENLADVSGHPAYCFLRGDTADTSVVATAFEDFDPQTVFHLAAESHVDRSITGPLDFIHSNVTGTVSLLLAARDRWGDAPGDRRFIQVSTDEVYGALGETGCFHEHSRHDPRSPYAASKAAADHLARAWWHTHRLPVVITHSSNNYGPCQHPEKFIPTCVLNALAGRPIPIYGDGRQVRDWLHVRDHCEALLRIAERGEPGRSYHVGANEEWRNLDLARRILEEIRRVDPSLAAGAPETVIHHVRDRPGHDFRYSLDTSAMRMELGWRAGIPFGAGLRETVRWFMDHHPMPSKET